MSTRNGRQGVFQAPGDGNTAAHRTGHADVVNTNIGLQFIRQAQCLISIRRFADDFEIRLSAEDGP